LQVIVPDCAFQQKSSGKIKSLSAVKNFSKSIQKRKNSKETAAQINATIYCYYHLSTELKRQTLSYTYYQDLSYYKYTYIPRVHVTAF